MSHSFKLFLFKLISHCGAGRLPVRPTPPCGIAPPPTRGANNVDGCGPLKHCFIKNLSRLRLAELLQRFVEVYQVVIRSLRLLAYVVLSVACITRRSKRRLRDDHRTHHTRGSSEKVAKVLPAMPEESGKPQLSASSSRAEGQKARTDAPLGRQDTQLDRLSRSKSTP